MLLYYSIAAFHLLGNYASGTYEKARLLFAHAETLVPFSCLLGLFLEQSGERFCYLAVWINTSKVCVCQISSIIPILHVKDVVSLLTPEYCRISTNTERRTSAIPSKVSPRKKIQGQHCVPFCREQHVGSLQLSCQIFKQVFCASTAQWTAHSNAGKL